jgi:hypothetical protein
MADDHLINPSTGNLDKIGMSSSEQEAYLKVDQPSGSEQATSGIFKLAAVETDQIRSSFDGQLALSLASKVLYDSVTYQSVDWGNRQLYDNIPNLSVDWRLRTLNDDQGVEVLRWDGGPVISKSLLCIAEPTFTYTAGVLTSIDYVDGTNKTLSYNGDGTLASLIVTYPFKDPIEKLFNYTGGVLTSITVVT